MNDELAGLASVTDEFVETWVDLVTAVIRWRRALFPDSAIHHINGRVWDNRPENLALVRIRGA